MSDKGKYLRADLAAFKFPKLGCKMIDLGDMVSAAMMIERTWGVIDLTTMGAMSKPSLQA